jgi:hypothetical protein
VWMRLRQPSSPQRGGHFPVFDSLTGRRY